MTTVEKVIRLNELGYSRATIARKCGVSTQRVHQILGKTTVQKKRKFEQWDEKSCVYPNLRTYLNIHKMTLTDLTFKIYGNLNYTNCTAVKLWLRNERTPSLRNARALADVTGLAFEVLFELPDIDS